jgi:hypothetical protein
VRPTPRAAAMVLLTVTRDPSEASLAAVKRDLGLTDEEIDDDFGIVEIDPNGHRYAILVREQAAGRVAEQPGVQGPFSNPRIEPFGPPDQ